MRILLAVLLLSCPAIAQDYVCRMSGDVVVNQGDRQIVVVGQWTGVAVSENLVLSVAHPKTSGDAVVEFGTRKIVATVIKADATLDMALYKCLELHGVKPIKVGNKHPIRARIAGFINRDRREVEYQVIDKHAYVYPEAPFLVLQGEAFHGMSGSPVIAEDGSLVGIQSGGDMDIKTTHSTRVDQVRRFLHGFVR